jgi:hypothetical protein
MSTEATEPTTAPATPPPYVPPKCDAPDCDKDAVWIYTWAWGDTGNCCATHGMLHQQKAKNLKRSVTLAALPAVAAPALTRDERVGFHARILAAEDELQEAKGRTAQLYEQNQVLSSELATRRRVHDALEAAHKDLRTDYERLRDDHHATICRLADVSDEVVRLKTLCDALEGGAKPSGDGDLAVPVDAPATDR